MNECECESDSDGASSQSNEDGEESDQEQERVQDEGQASERPLLARMASLRRHMLAGTLGI